MGCSCGTPCCKGGAICGVVDSSYETSFSDDFQGYSDGDDLSLEDYYAPPPSPGTQPEAVDYGSGAIGVEWSGTQFTFPQPVGSAGAHRRISFDVGLYETCSFEFEYIEGDETSYGAFLLDADIAKITIGTGSTTMLAGASSQVVVHTLAANDVFKLEVTRTAENHPTNWTYDFKLYINSVLEGTLSGNTTTTFPCEGLYGINSFNTAFGAPSYSFITDNWEMEVVGA